MLLRRLTLSLLLPLTFLGGGCISENSNKFCEYQSNISSPISPLKYEIYTTQDISGNGNISYSVLGKNGISFKSYRNIKVYMPYNICDKALDIINRSDDNYHTSEKIFLDSTYVDTIVHSSNFNIQRAVDLKNRSKNDDLLNLSREVVLGAVDKIFIPSDPRWSTIPSGLSSQFE